MLTSVNTRLTVAERYTALNCNDHNEIKKGCFCAPMAPLML